MTSTFGDQILAEKLAKLNSSQQSIETLSHWCIFHRKRAAQVVQRWEKEFQAAPKPRKVPFLFLANDILQNSRRKGPEFVNEFWKVLPAALKDITQYGENSTRETVDRLLTIWEERKVFGSRDKNLKDAFLGPASPAAAPLPRSNSKVKEKQTAGVATSPQVAPLQLSGPLEKIATAHAAVQELAGEEDSALRKCNAIVSDLKALEEQLPRRAVAGPSAITAVAEELQAKQGALAKWANQLEACEKRRSTLVNLLREALRTQESKLDRIRSQVQSAQAQAEHALSVRHRLLTSGGKQGVETVGGPQNGAVPGPSGGSPMATPSEQAVGPAEVAAPGANGSAAAVPAKQEQPSSQAGPGEGGGNPPGELPGGSAPVPAASVQAPSQSAPPAVVPSSDETKEGLQELSVGAVGPSGEEARKKLEAAELAIKLASSASSAAMLSSVLSSLAAEGDLPASFRNFGQMRPAAGLQMPPEKRPRFDAPGEGQQGAPGGGFLGSGADLGGAFPQPHPPPSAFMGSPPLIGPQGGNPYGGPMAARPRPPQPIGAPPPLPHQPPPFQPPTPLPGFGQTYNPSPGPFHSQNPNPPAPPPAPRSSAPA